MKKYILIINILYLWLTSLVFAGNSIFGLQPGLIGINQYQYSTAALGRGGFEMAFIDSLGINQSNYALWTSISRTTFSLSLKYYGISSETETFDLYSSDANFQGGFIVMPLIQKKLAFGFGLTPLSVNNQKAQERISTFTPGTVDALSELELKGNITEAKFALAYAPNNKLSIAFFANYNFGMISEKRLIDFDGGVYDNIEYENQYRIYGGGIGFSGFYRVSSNFNTGFSLKFPIKLTKYNKQFSSSAESDLKEFESLELPSAYIFGVSYKIKDRWFTGMDIDYQKWESEYKIEKSTINNMNNSIRIGAGVERIPSFRRLTSYFDKMTYRGGIFFSKLNVKSNNQSVNEYGLSLGVGLPIHVLTNRLDISFEMGKRGSLDKNLLKENFIRFNISLSTSELWFIQQDR